MNARLRKRHRRAAGFTVGRIGDTLPDLTYPVEELGAGHCRRWASPRRTASHQFSQDTLEGRQAADADRRHAVRSHAPMAPPC